MKTTNEVENKAGITLGELLDFAAKCSAAGMPNAARIKARISWGGRLQLMSIEAEAKH